MKAKTVIPSVAAAGVFLALCWLFSGAPSNASLLMSLNPIDALAGLSFALAFAAGLPLYLAIPAAGAVFILIPTAVYFISRHWLS